jgi:Xaa-Pro aminopeptidase
LLFQQGIEFSPSKAGGQGSKGEIESAYHLVHPCTLAPLHPCHLVNEIFLAFKQRSPYITSATHNNHIIAMKILLFVFAIIITSNLTAAQPVELSRIEILRKKVATILPAAMREHNIDCWLVFTRENARDPIAADIGGGGVVARGAFIFHLGKEKFSKIAIVASYDVTPVKESGIYDTVISYRNEGAKPHIKTIIEQLQPQKIGINISRDETLADGLTVGMRDYLVETLGEQWAKKFVSAEDVVVSFRSRKLPEELGIIRKAVEMTQEIIASCLTSTVIASGKTTEADLGKALEQKTKAMGAEIAFNSVTIGVSRGHSSPTENIIHKGDLIRIDFGIAYHGYKTDIQRTAYVLKDGETTVPEPIQKMWRTIVKANQASVAAMKPGVAANAADVAGRTTIVNAGYQEYPHAAGHPIGFEVHDAGPILGPDWKERYGAKVFRKLEIGQTYAVEPIVSMYDETLKGEINVGLEEDVVIEADGAKYLGTPQTELILIR